MVLPLEEYIYIRNTSRISVNLLLLQTFETELDSDCSYDFLAIRDGRNANSKLLRQLCGYIYPEFITSSGNHLYLRFVADENTGGFGFNISYTVHDPIRK